jgi:ABC-2 type transport system permease protein
MIKQFLKDGKTHLKIFLSLAKHSIQRDMAYRLDFISNLVSSVGWVNYSLVLILVLNSVTGGFGGWDKSQMLLLIGSWMINNGLAYFFFYRNMKQVVNDVHKGDLDYVLIKPLDSQFFVSFRRVILNAMCGVIEGFIVVIYALTAMNVAPSPFDVIKYFILTAVSLSLYYSIWFFAASLSIHFILADNLFYAVPDLAEVSKFPGSAYPKNLEYVFSSLIPIILFTTFPAEAIMGQQSTLKFFYAIVVGIIFFCFTRWFWFWSLKRYTSASS